MAVLAFEFLCYYLFLDTFSDLHIKFKKHFFLLLISDGANSSRKSTSSRKGLKHILKELQLLNQMVNVSIDNTASLEIGKQDIEQGQVFDCGLCLWCR